MHVIMYNIHIFEIRLLNEVVMKDDLKIDLVYLWVDGNDPKWLEEKEIWREKLGIESSPAANNCRFIDNQELKYSLRSVEMNAPWINRIFIVTNGQIPAWLDTTHPKIKIVDHKDIMPANALPTFNSEAIEACLMNIPDLSEYFLYANDDFFINRPVTPDFFFDKNNQPIVRLRRQNWKDEEIESKLYLKNVTCSMELIKNVYGKEYRLETAHNIDSYRKSDLIKCKNEFKKEFDRVINCKFRTENSVQRTIFSFYVLANNVGTLQDCTKSSETLCLRLTPPNYMRRVIKSQKPCLLCINDDVNVNPDNRKLLKQFLSELYPTRQEWEKKVSFQIEPAFKDEHARTIVFAPDNNYCKYFGVALLSLIDHSRKEDNYDLIVFESDITERNKKLLQSLLPPNFSLRFFDINDFISEQIGAISFETREYWSISMYYRIFIPILMQKYKKVLYCDADICFNQPLDELFNIDFEGKELLAVWDSITPIMNLDKGRARHILEELALPNPQEYFNSGVLMFNIPAIKLDNYLESFKTALTTKELRFPDQDILNIMFNGKLKTLPMKYNYQYHLPIFRKNYLNEIWGDFIKDFLAARENPVIIHYTSSRKPWHAPQEEWANVFWNYARKSPFYEEIMYHNFKIGGVSVETIKNLNHKGRIYYNYYKSKIFSFLTFGKRKKHYQEKRDKFKIRVQEIRKFSKL